MSSENQQLLIACQYKALVHKITIPVSYYQYHHKLHFDSCIMYYQVTQNKLKMFKPYWGGDTRQILDNL